MNRSGKRKGTLSKTTRILRQAILLGAESAGNEVKPGHPNGALAAYMHHIATTQPVAFTNLLGRLLPPQSDAADPADEGKAVTICFESPDKAR